MCFLDKNVPDKQQMCRLPHPTRGPNNKAGPPVRSINADSDVLAVSISPPLSVPMSHVSEWAIFIITICF